MENQRPFLEARNINKSYFQGEIEVRALVGINLTIMEEQVVAIFGPSGAGKSTLLHILGALDRPTRGEVIFQNSNITTLSDNELARLRNREIGFIFQFHHLLPEFTALENVMMPLLIARSSSGEGNLPYREMKQRGGEIAKESLRILTQVGLKDRINHTPAELSVGEQQRVAVARALINSPKAILADEPTGNLDRKTGDAVFELLLKLNRERGKTLVIVTHNEVLVEKIAGLGSGRVIYLRDGKIIS